MYYSGVHDQRSAYSTTAYGSYASYTNNNFIGSINDNRPALYNNTSYAYTNYATNSSYPSYAQAPSYPSFNSSSNGRGVEQHREGHFQQRHQLDNTALSDKSYTSAFARPFNGYSNPNSQSFYNEYSDYKSLSSEITTRTDVSEHGADKYLPPCALQYYETDMDSNEDDELMLEQRNSCAYAPTIGRNANRFRNDRAVAIPFDHSFGDAGFKTISPYSILEV
eukprot:gene14326-15816_t